MASPCKCNLEDFVSSDKRGKSCKRLFARPSYSNKKGVATRCADNTGDLIRKNSLNSPRGAQNSTKSIEVLNIRICTIWCETDNYTTYRQMNVHLNWMLHEVTIKRTNWFLSRLSQGFLSHHMGKQSLPLRDESLHLWKTPDLGLLLERYRYTSPCTGPASHSKNPTSAPAKHNACLFHLQGLSRTGFKTGYSKKPLHTTVPYTW